MGIGQRGARTLSPEQCLSLRLYSDEGLIVQNRILGERAKIGEPVSPYSLKHWKSKLGSTGLC